MGQVVTTMKGINDSSKKISDIIGLIDEIASQTDILALNVAVEAARAGEQGMGFAVAASQVPPVTSKPFPAWIRARNKTPRWLTSLPSQPSRSSRRRRR